MDKTRKVRIDWQRKVATATAHSGDKQYTVNVHFDDQEKLIRAAVEWAVIKTNIQARTGKIENGQTYEVDCWGNVHETIEQIVNKMSPELKAAVAAQLEAERKAAKKAA